MSVDLCWSRRTSLFLFVNGTTALFWNLNINVTIIFPKCLSLETFYLESAHYLCVWEVRIYWENLSLCSLPLCSQYLLSKLYILLIWIGSWIHFVIYVWDTEIAVRERNIKYLIQPCKLILISVCWAMRCLWRPAALLTYITRVPKKINVAMSVIIWMLPVLHLSWRNAGCVTDCV